MLSYSGFSAFDPACPVPEWPLQAREPHRRFGSGRWRNRPFPQGVTWTAVPGPGMPADDPSIQLAVDQTAAPLASALSLYNWKWLSSPAQAENADVIVRIRWNTSNPQYIREVVPVFRPGIGLGMGWGHGPWRRGPFYGGYGGYYAEPAIQTIYTRSLTVEALRSADLSPEVRAAVLHRPTTGMQNDPQTPAASSPAREDLLEASLRAGPESGRKRSTAFRQARPSGERRSLCTAHSGFRHGRNTGGSNSLARGSLERQLEIQHTENTSAACGRGGSGCGQDHPDGRVRGQ